MKYDYNVSLHRRRSFLKHLFTAFAVVLLLFCAVVIAIKIDSYLQDDRNTSSQTTSSQTTGYFAPTTQIFRTPYFQFQTDKNWAEVPSESNGSKFVYRSLRKNLVEHDLTVYVNDVPSNLSATHVLPVNLKTSGSELEPLNVSNHCKTATGTMTAADQQIEFSGVSMLCNLDSPQYEVIVGKKGGSTTITMKRPGGTSAKYSIFYRNVTATPEPSQLYDIVNSFQTR